MSGFNNLKKRLSDPIGWLISQVKALGFEGVFDRYYGVYRGLVIDIDDPEDRGRVRVKIPSIGHVEDSDVPLNIWALPCGQGLSVGDSGEQHGFTYVPMLGDQLWIMFEKGLTSNPIYIGGWLHAGAINKDMFGDVEVKGMRTASGHVLRFEEGGSVRLGRGESGLETNALIQFNDDGTVLLSNDHNSTVRLTDNEIECVARDGSVVVLGNDKISLVNATGTSLSIDGGKLEAVANDSISLTAKSIVLKGNVDLGLGPIYEEAVTGTSFASAVWVPHTHPVVSIGAPSGPPITPPPIPSSGLSTSVRISK